MGGTYGDELLVDLIVEPTGLDGIGESFDINVASGVDCRGNFAGYVIVIDHLCVSLANKTQDCDRIYRRLE